MKPCIVCEKPVDNKAWAQLVEDLEHVFDQADAFGMASLTEQKQLLVEGNVCSASCYELL